MKFYNLFDDIPSQWVSTNLLEQRAQYGYQLHTFICQNLKLKDILFLYKKFYGVKKRIYPPPLPISYPPGRAYDIAFISVFEFTGEGEIYSFYLIKARLK